MDKQLEPITLDKIEISTEVSEKYEIVDNTFRQEVKPNPKDRLTCEIGDIKEPDTFFPQAKINRWGTSKDTNEVNASFRYIDNELTPHTVEVEKNIVKYVNEKSEVHFYDLEPAEQREDGGLEIEILLKEIPTQNLVGDEYVFGFSIQTKGLNFFYQPPLTQEEILEGASRPENVEGSYAVYHSTKGRMNDIAGMEYKVGKAFHIYRPKVTDANGNETWGELNIDEQNGLLTVTIDQAWLDNAVYPVIVDPTFGYTSIGATNTLMSANDSFATIFNLPENGDVTEVVCGLYNGAASGENFKGLIYDDDGASTTPGTLLGVGAGTANTDTSTSAAGASFQSSSLSLALNAGNYGLGFVTDTSQGIARDSETGFTLHQDTSYSYASPDNFVQTGSVANYRMSIYATYTASGGSAPVTGPFMTTNTGWFGG